MVNKLGPDGAGDARSCSGCRRTFWHISGCRCFPSFRPDAENRPTREGRREAGRGAEEKGDAPISKFSFSLSAVCFPLVEGQAEHVAGMRMHQIQGRKPENLPPSLVWSGLQSYLPPG